MSDHTTSDDSAGGSADEDSADEVGYAEALDELDAILRELEGSDVDVDRLADRVARAADLIGACRSRISAARLRIDEVIADLDAASDLGDAGGPGAS